MLGSFCIQDVSDAVHIGCLWSGSLFVSRSLACIMDMWCLYHELAHWGPANFSSDTLKSMLHTMIESVNVRWVEYSKLVVTTSGREFVTCLLCNLCTF